MKKKQPERAGSNSTTDSIWFIRSFRRMTISVAGGRIRRCPEYVGNEMTKKVYGCDLKKSDANFQIKTNIIFNDPVSLKRNRKKGVS